MAKLIEVPMSVDPEAVKIGDLYRSAKRGTVEAVQQLLECGSRLSAKKKLLRHGEWLPWLTTNQKTLGFETRQTAAMLMTAARNVKPALHLTEAEALALSKKLWGHDPSPEEAERQAERDAYRADLATAAESVPPSDRYQITQADLRNWVAPRQYDWIITDPPYPREYLKLYSALAERAVNWLKPGGLLIAMCGQSYLDQIYAMLCEHLDYYWTAAYLLPGQPTPLRQVNVNCSWKPLLIYCRKGENYTGKIFGDVFRSDANEKDFHKWGQSVSGMRDIVSRLCIPGEYILDPFCGAGTTGIAAINHGCFFDGIELDAQNVKIARKRIYDAA